MCGYGARPLQRNWRREEYLHDRSPIPSIISIRSYIKQFMGALGTQSHSPEMHSLQSNRTIPHPLEPVLFYRRRSCTLPSLCLLPESTSRRPESLTVCEEVGRAERWTSGAEEGRCCGHCGFVPLLLLSLGWSIEKCESGEWREMKSKWVNWKKFLFPPRLMFSANC